MASVHTRKRGRGKASSLDVVEKPEVRPQPEMEKTAANVERDFMPVAKASNSKRLKWWADLTVILLVILVAVAGVFGYRFLRKSAKDAAAAKTVTIGYTVCLQEVPSGTDPEALVGKSMNLLSQSDTWNLGTIKQAKWDDDTCSVLVSIQVEAQYRAGEGYRVHGQRLLAGSTFQGSCVVGDVSATGTIVSMNRI